MDLILKSERLTLIPFQEGDVDIAIELFTSPEVRRYAGGAMDASAVRKAMPDWLRRGGNGCIGVWCITETGSGEKLGSGALLPMPVEEDETDWSLVVPGKMPDAEVEIGYFLKPSAWGRGIATEACRRLLQLAFEDSPLTEVVATHDEGNVASRNVLLKSGFIDLGSSRCYGQEAPYLRATRADWLKRQ